MRLVRGRALGWLLIAAILAAAAAVGWLIVTVPARSIPPLSATEIEAVKDPAGRLTVADNRAKLRNDMRVSMLQGVTALAVAGGLIFTYRTFRMNREGQVTERFTKAIDQIGQHEKPDVVLGGIYSLSRIARDSRADRQAIRDVLAAHVRRLAPYPPPPGGLPATAAVNQIPPYRERLPTAHVALAAIAGLERAGHGADLRDTDLRGADLEGAGMRGWRLRGAQLTAAGLREADLREADLRDTDLRGADLRQADLRDADLSGAVLTHADLTAARDDDGTRWPGGQRPPQPRQPGDQAMRYGSRSTGTGGMDDGRRRSDGVDR
ncbi:pentapeptide repeat-containing protein [Actinoplanes sp. NPDC048988]|uniref:pentapeptide repeat-containing protein n=1 Tax=Actinoplanes sp. NPDC048988 TaxID=3363901 RepID=UPI0037169A9C